MAIERTLSMIKPEAVARNEIGGIYSMLEDNGLNIIAARMIHLSLAQAQQFYGVHKERPFFGELTEYMSSGPVMVQCLEGENAIENYRNLMGATNPVEAAEGTIRQRFAANVPEPSIQENAVHGSDAPETAAVEIAFFFEDSEICPR